MASGRGPSSKPLFDWIDWAIERGDIIPTSRGRPGCAAVAVMLSAILVRMGDKPSHYRMTTQTVFNWHKRGRVPTEMVRAIAKLMKLQSSDEYHELAKRGGWKPQPPPKPLAKVDPITPKAKKITSRVE
jgi:hypothetical protein